MNKLRYCLAALVGLGLVALAGCGPAAQPTPTATRVAAPVATSTPVVAATPTPTPPLRATPTPAPAATPTPAGPQPKYGGVVTISHAGDPGSFDLMRVSGGQTITLVSLMYNSLLSPCRENSLEICPSLAASWQSNADFTQWTFKITDNVVWHDGTPFTAEDVRWWIELAIKGAKGRTPARFAALLGDIAKVEALAGNQLRVTLNSPAGGYPAMYATATYGLVQHPRHLTQPQIDKGNASVIPSEVGWVGTGPYRLSKYDKGVTFQVRKFDRYFEKDAQGRRLPFLDGVDYIFLIEPATGFAAFRTGRIDVTTNNSRSYIRPEQVPILEREMKNEYYLVTLGPNGRVIGVNARRVPLNDVRVRQAIHLTLDRQSFIDSAESGLGVPVALWFPDSPLANKDFMTWPGFNPKTKEQDRQRAKALLAEAGYPNGFKLSILTATQWSSWSEWVKSQLDPLLGAANVSIDLVDAATWNTKRCNAAFDLINPIASDLSGRHSPEFLAGALVTTNSCSYFQHDDKRVDDLMKRLVAEGNQAKRIPLAQELERYLILEQALVIPVNLELSNRIALRNYVKGWVIPKLSPFENGDFATLWLDK